MRVHFQRNIIQLILLVCGTFVQLAYAGTPPNIILINADDLGYGDLGCYGAVMVKTPNIDQLAAEGRRYTDAHSASAVCSPSRYGLLTGQYPLRKNFWGPTPHTQALTIDMEQPTIATILKNAGYDTAAIGKWHLGFGTEKTDWNQPLKPGPLEIGFDYYFGMPTVNSGPPFVYVKNHNVVDYDPEDPFVFGRDQKSVTQSWPEKGGQRGIGGAKKAHLAYRDEYVGTTLTEKAIDWLKQRNKKDPFFLYFATTNIHHPFTPHPRFKNTSKCGPYGDFIHELDWMVGGLLRTLKETGQADNTLIVFTSDNGGMLNQGGQQAWQSGHRLNGKLLGFKFGAWEGGHRVPFIVKWPGKVPPGSVSHALVSQIDLLATFASAAGTSIPEESELDSINQLNEFLGKAKEPLRDTLIISPNSPKHLLIRKGNWVYIPARGEGGFQGRKPGEHLFSGEFSQSLTKLVNSDVANGRIREDAPDGQLYNLKQDPYQATNLHDQHPEVVSDLAMELDRYRKRIPPGKRLGWINLKQ